MQATNWNKQEDYVNMFWKQNVQQFWTEEEFPVSKDIASWRTLPSSEQSTYKHVLAGLTGLDTLQGTEGMPLLATHITEGRKQAVLTFMAMMENIHTKSYSHIFTTLIPSAETESLLSEWVPSQPHLAYKAEIISRHYQALLQPAPEKLDVYMACVASVFLESFLFYSGFYYPLYLAGQGRMTTSGEIIRKILLDESIHGVFVGMLAQELYEGLSDLDMAEAAERSETLLDELYRNELEYTAEIYGPLGEDVVADVIRYVEYNGNKALSNLGLEPAFAPEPFSAIVLNGLDTGTKHHDFFSQKGDGYVMALNVEPIRDEDFVFER
ncbi:class 1b ribonucleoside-diphosphate reductase subunit beta [Paenibacillus sp. GCM10012307]|uniref:ribonucleoside-diphosphate reductase n=1 Tax=Paenibacillus roseus TaxID=2798579 RepID=A0A934J3P6_9BACL|nr:class 1b ribonucleoside-diphosphate reductase subunit beta [Paenibacillus roseus]MBJ6364186.1 class 1b ribonucleoside-diphosphate reductase subunit beta [Paenibacillus roseus]